MRRCGLHDEHPVPQWQFQSEAALRRDSPTYVRWRVSTERGVLQSIPSNRVHGYLHAASKSPYNMLNSSRTLGWRLRVHISLRIAESIWFVTSLRHKLREGVSSVQDARTSSSETPGTSFNVSRTLILTKMAGETKFELQTASAGNDFHVSFLQPESTTQGNAVAYLFQERPYTGDEPGDRQGVTLHRCKVTGPIFATHDLGWSALLSRLKVIGKRLTSSLSRSWENAWAWGR